MKSSDFFYELPPHLIAQSPLKHRSDSRLLVYDRDTKDIHHATFNDLGAYLRPGDLLVFNDTRVMQARLFGHKATGGKLELLVERIADEKTFYTHIKASKALKPGQLFSIGGTVDVEMSRREGDLFVCKLKNKMSVPDLLEEYGHMPLPPYITRSSDEEDTSRYQTVYANELGAVAAPTAGLHFNDPLMTSLKEAGIQTAFLTLHVGAGTFQPVRVENVSDHVMHSEWVNVSQDLVDTIAKTKQLGGRVIAVGTTAVRSLETAALSEELKRYEGETDIFIYPGFRFKVVDAMITNFHLPESTLLMLVSAFCDKESVQNLYQTAISKEYRFFSYGDASLIL